LSAEVSATTSAAASEHRIFVTSTTYTGNLGGLSGADDKCQTQGASLGGTWKALLSTPTVNAKDRVTIVGPVKNLRPAGSGGPQTIATNAADLWNGNIGFPVRYSESGGSINGLWDVYTATDSDGNYDGWSGACSNWASTAGGIYVTVGSSNAAGADWIAAEDGDCGESRRLYCIEQ
jgi:hypothetical protein